MDQFQAKAARALFTAVSIKEPRLLPLKKWYAEVLIPTIDKWAINEGNSGIKRAKNILSRGFSLILGEKFSRAEALDFTKSDADGVPTLVKPLVTRCRQFLSETAPHPRDVNLMNCALSICRVTDLWLGKPSDVDLEASLRRIERKPLTARGAQTLNEFSEFVKLFITNASRRPDMKQFMKALTRTLRIGGTNTARHAYTCVPYSSKSGPNGPRTMSMHKDLESLDEAICQDGVSLLGHVGRLSEMVVENSDPGTGWNAFWFLPSDPHGLMAACRAGAYRQLHGDDQEPSTQELANVIRHASAPGKLAFKPEKSGKVRIIAEVDGLSQATLMPIHDWLMGVLRTFEADCTFDQRSSIPKISEWQESGRTVYSFDHTACTDLFPIDVQLVILQERFGKPFADEVKTVMVDRDWEVHFPSSHQKRTVRWTVGQPLGAYASWPLMALAHHLLVQFSAWKAKGKLSQFPPFRDYVICGDDIVIGSKTVADSYLRIVRDLGMIINMLKSHVSGGSTGVPPVSEFAKIIVWRGQPLNPLRPNVVLAAVKDWRMMVPLLLELCSGDRWRFKIPAARRIIMMLHPSKKKILEYLLTVPTELGGIGIATGLTLRQRLTVVHGSEIHPWLLYLAMKIRSSLKLESKAMKFDCGSLLDEVGPLAFRMHPIYSYYQERMTELPSLLGQALRSQVIPTPYEIAESLLRGAGYGNLTRFYTEQVVPAPDVDREVVAKRLKANGSIWSWVLKRQRKWPQGSLKLMPRDDVTSVFIDDAQLRPDYQSDRLMNVFQTYLTVASI